MTPMSDLRTWRKAKDLSRAELGELVGVTAVAIGRYENGRVPDANVLQKIIDVSGGAVTANDFFEVPGSVLQEQGAAA